MMGSRDFHLNLAWGSTIPTFRHWCILGLQSTHFAAEYRFPISETCEAKVELGIHTGDPVQFGRWHSMWFILGVGFLLWTMGQIQMFIENHDRCDRGGLPHDQAPHEACWRARKKKMTASQNWGMYTCIGMDKSMVKAKENDLNMVEVPCILYWEVCGQIYEDLACGWYMEKTLKDTESVFIFQTHFRLPIIHRAIWRFTQRPCFPCDSASGGGYAGELSRRGSGLSLDLHSGKAAICFLPFVNVTWFLLSPDIFLSKYISYPRCSMYTCIY